jgi:molecular chaperone DnaK
MARDNKLLGTFRLDGIRPAQRGIPRIEVSFDIDANGILNVTAKDLGTGKEQKITITASTNLNKDDIERLIKEAESNAAEDKRNKESADARNEADNLCYAVEREVREGGASDTNKQRAETLVADVRRKIESRASAEELKPLMNDLRGLVVQLQQDAQASRQSSTGGGESSGPNGGGSGAGTASGAGASAGAGDDIVDAEIS